MEEIKSKKEITMKIIELEKELRPGCTGNTKELIRAKVDILKLAIRIGNKKDITMKMLELQKELEYRYNDSTKELIRAKVDILKWVICQT
jgi:hypothetical protein